ncbi:MAG: cytochrome P450 [Verrucomicrobiales bacterium]|jgi:cytochrome P450
MAARTVEPITAKVVIDSYADIRAALMNQDLSRTFDKRTYAEGNVRDGVVSIMHGPAHRDRRRLENTQFRPKELQLYEQTLFPPLVESMVDEAALAGEVDLFALGERLSVVLAARRAGFDLDDDDHAGRDELAAFVDQFSQASAILDAKDPDAIRASVREAHRDFFDRFGEPSIARRVAALEAFNRGDIAERELPHDILTNLLRHREQEELGLSDESVLVREAGTYLQGGTHTSAQTLVNAIDLLIESRDAGADFFDRAREDRSFAQRCMHETLRLRPTTPEMKRRAENATTVAGIEIPQGALVVLDIMKGNRDTKLFGADADVFNPNRDVFARTPLWGLSFGAGPHICPGFKVAGGQQQPPDHGPLIDDHLFGLVANMIQTVAQHNPSQHPSKPRTRDDRTERFTRWSDYWIVFENDDENPDQQELTQ